MTTIGVSIGAVNVSSGTGSPGLSWTKSTSREPLCVSGTDYSDYISAFSESVVELQLHSNLMINALMFSTSLTIHIERERKRCWYRSVAYPICRSVGLSVSPESVFSLL